MYVTPSLMVMEVAPLQYRNASSWMVETRPGMVMDLRASHWRKAPCSMIICAEPSPCSMVRDSRAKHHWKADCPTRVTVAGMVKEVRASHCSKA